VSRRRNSVARNRKRAKERRARRPTPVAQPRGSSEPAAPSPIEHASPDIELAEAQLAVGRPETDELPDDTPEVNAEPIADDVADPQGEIAGDVELGAYDSDEYIEEENGELDEETGLAHLRRKGGEPGSPDGMPSFAAGVPDSDPGDARGVAVGDAGVAPARARPGTRLITFLQGSWNELQRVQWPDRRQTLQATGVVIGFVIVAGVFLGVTDALAAKLVNYILGK
jgi:preprotein translocase subunit SecE